MHGLRARAAASVVTRRSALTLGDYYLDYYLDHCIDY
jgi:hypothetical protein